MKKQKQKQEEEKLKEEQEEVQQHILRGMNYSDYKQLNLLSDYYQIDEGEKVVHVPYHFKKGSQLLDCAYRSPDSSFFSPAVLSSFKSDLNRIPPGFDAELDLRVDDYEGIQPESLTKKLADEGKISKYESGFGRRKSTFTGIFLAIIGVAVLFLISYFTVKKALGDDENGRIISEILEDVASVLIWEAITVLFVAPTEDDTLGDESMKKIRQLNFYDKEGKLISSLPFGTKKRGRVIPPFRDTFEMLVRLSLLVAGSALLALSFSHLFRVITYTAFPEEGMGTAERWVGGAINVVEMVLLFGAGMGTYKTYLGSSKFHWAYAITMMILTTLFAFSVYGYANEAFGKGTSNSVHNFVVSILDLVFCLISTGAYFLQGKRPKKN